MAIVKEYRCAGHGPFEATEQKCPQGCPDAWVVREFRTAPKIKHNATRTADNAIRHLAADYGLTNVSNRDGMSVMDALRRPTKQDDFKPRFMDVPHAQPGFSQTDGAKRPVVDPQAAIGGSTAQGENSMARAFGLTQEGRGGDSDGRVVIPRPRPVVDPKLVYRPSELPSAAE